MLSKHVLNHTRKGCVAPSWKYVGKKFAYVAKLCTVTQEESRQEEALQGSEGVLVSRMLVWLAWSPGLYHKCHVNGVWWYISIISALRL